MGAESKIEWTDATWNPTRGCSRISEGCRHCYAEFAAARFSSKGQPYEGLVTLGKQGPRWNGTVRLVPEMLRVPLGWKKPKRIFVNSMSDLFHESLCDEDIDRVFGVMSACEYQGNRHGDAFPWHTFQVLTKRAERMRAYMAQDRRREWAYWAVTYGGGHNPDGLYDQVAGRKGPPRHIWLGVSVENQAAADERIPHLLATPAAVRFLSVEPLLERVRLDAWLRAAPRPDWVILGGESGPGARVCAVEWLCFLADECRDAGVPVFVKQLGARPVTVDLGGSEYSSGGSGFLPVRLKDRKGGDINEFPSRLRVREFPEVRRG